MNDLNLIIHLTDKILHYLDSGDKGQYLYYLKMLNIELNDGKDEDVFLHM